MRLGFLGGEAEEEEEEEEEEGGGGLSNIQESVCGLFKSSLWLTARLGPPLTSLSHCVCVCVCARARARVLRTKSNRALLKRCPSLFDSHPHWSRSLHESLVLFREKKERKKKNIKYFFLFFSFFFFKHADRVSK